MFHFLLQQLKYAIKVSGQSEFVQLAFSTAFVMGEVQTGDVRNTHVSFSPKIQDGHHFHGNKTREKNSFVLYPYFFHTDHIQ